MKRHPNKIRSALKIGSSVAGAARIGESISATERIGNDAVNFLRLGRAVDVDFSLGDLTFNELGWLVILHLRTNAHNGRVRVSYQTLSEESGGQFSRNDLNKILLRLREKRFIWFEKRAGRRRPAEVRVNYYPLSTGGFTDLTALFDSEVREFLTLDAEAGIEVETEVNAEVETEVVFPVQRKSEENSKILEQMFGLGYKSSRGSNNDNNEEYEEDKKSILLKEEKRYETNEHDEMRIRKIAHELGEPHVRLVHARARQYGMDIVEEAYRLTVLHSQNENIENLGAYFNVVSDALGKRKHLN